MRPDGWAYTAFLGALSALPPLSIDMGLPGIPAIEAAFPGAAGQGALTLSLFLAGFAVSPLCCGPIADRFGRKPTLAVGLLALTLAAAACVVAPSFPLLLGFRLMQGIAAGACVTLPLAVVRDVFDGETARHHLSRITAVVGIAPMLAPMLGGWIMSFSTWRTIYGAQALCGLVLLLVTLLCFDETLPVGRRRALHPAAVAGSYGLVLRNRAFVGSTALYAFTFACMFSFISSASAVLMGELRLGSGVFALVFGVTSCGTMLGAIASFRLAARGVGGAALIRSGVVAAVLAGLVLLALALSGTARVGFVLPPVFVVMCCFGLIGPNANHDALAGLPQVAGAASGMLRCVQMVAGALASAAVALLHPLDRPLLVMAGLMLAASLGAAACLAGMRRATASLPPPAELDEVTP